MISLEHKCTDVKSGREKTNMLFGTCVTWGFQYLLLNRVSQVLYITTVAMVTCMKNTSVVVVAVVVVVMKTERERVNTVKSNKLHD